MQRTRFLQKTIQVQCENVHQFIHVLDTCGVKSRAKEMALFTCSLISYFLVSENGPYISAGHLSCFSGR